MPQHLSAALVVGILCGARRRKRMSTHMPARMSTHMSTRMTTQTAMSMHTPGHFLFFISTSPAALRGTVATSYTHVFTHVCTHARTHARTHVKTHACKNARMHTCMRLHTHLCAHMCMRMSIHTGALRSGTAFVQTRASQIGRVQPRRPCRAPSLTSSHGLYSYGLYS